jgi:hypothetical protein
MIGAEIEDDPLPSRAALEALLPRLHPAGGELDPADLAELIEAARWALHAIPKELDFLDFCLRNPISQLYFRAGLLACREYMARFVEQGGDAQTAASIRANWWPQFGADPGPPRLFTFDEVAEEIHHEDGTVSYASRPISASIEALPRAFQFLATPVAEESSKARHASGLEGGASVPREK